MLYLNPNLKKNMEKQIRSVLTVISQIIETRLRNNVEVVETECDIGDKENLLWIIKTLKRDLRECEKNRI